ncbi:MAG: HAAS signaling domain-containing protein, partial [Actinomycetota bacterium]
MNVTLTRAQAVFLDQVREELADIPSDEREEVIGDLEAHLAEILDDEIEAELGAPADFARELRISAG